MRLKLDENLPAELAEDLRAVGHDVDTVSSEGRGGSADHVVATAARSTAGPPHGGDDPNPLPLQIGKCATRATDVDAGFGPKCHPPCRDPRPDRLRDVEVHDGLLPEGAEVIYCVVPISECHGLATR